MLFGDATEPAIVLPKKTRRLVKKSVRVVDTKTFLIAAREQHGDYYDYSKVFYRASKKTVTIICPVHGPFEQTPNSHLNKRGCLECRFESFTMRRRSDSVRAGEAFAAKAAAKHNSKMAMARSCIEGPKRPSRSRARSMVISAKHRGITFMDAGAGRAATVSRRMTRRNPPGWPDGLSFTDGVAKRHTHTHWKNSHEHGDEHDRRRSSNSG
jgi:ferredoxin-like protein FixX